jgi:hypothetical protein
MTSSGLAEYSQDMEGRNNMSLAIEKILVSATSQPTRPAVEETDPRLNICVVFTSVAATLMALKEAGALAVSLGARITLLVPQVVPYPLPLESPPVLVDFNEKRFRVIASESPVETKVRIYLCRDQFETLSTVLKPSSLVVLGVTRKWWPTPERRLARKLRKAGHEVIMKETE